MSTDISIAITYSAQTNEIDLRISPLSYKEASYDLYEFIELKSPRESKSWKSIQASSKGDFEALLCKMLELLRKYCLPAIQGDVDIFQKLSIRQKERMMQRLLSYRLSDIRKQADERWHAKDYRKATELLESIEDELTASEKTKLSICRKHVNSS